MPRSADAAPSAPLGPAIAAAVPLGITIPFADGSTKKQTSSQPSPAWVTVTTSAATDAVAIATSPRRSNRVAPSRLTARLPITDNVIRPAELVANTTLNS